MRALTVRQPWAWAIVHGGKDVENRTRNLAGSYRGPVALHAGLTVDFTAGGDERIDAAFRRRPRSVSLSDIRGCEARGAFIGVVDLVGVHEAVGEYAVCCSSPWGEPHVWHLEVANPRPLATPIPARGALGLWTPTDEQAAAIREGLR